MSPTHLKIARLISILHISVGLLFWIWSITLWARGQYDSGIVLFLFPIATGLMGLRIVYQCGGQASNHSNDSEDLEVEAGTSTDQNQTPTSTGKCCHDCNSNQHPPQTKCWFILLLLTHVLTTTVYAYAGARGMEDFDKSHGYQLYCQIAAVCWAVSGVIIGVLACRFRDSFKVVIGGGEGGR